MGLKTISPNELHQLMREQPVSVVDVNSVQSWRQAHVPGAKHLEPTGYRVDDLPPDKNSTLVFYCSNSWCRKAPTAARRAESMGYTNVHVMSAGISGWFGAQLPTEAGS
jgi:rhodanese-related sulfurtransferase